MNDIHGLCKRNARQNGYILVTTLWILSAAVLSAGYFAGWVLDALSEAHSSKEAFQSRMDRVSTRSALLYLLGTRHISHKGLHTEEERETVKTFASTPAPVGKSIPLDDRPCAGIGGVRFSIQDEQALAGLNRFERSRMERLLGLLNVPAAGRGPLLDKLKDYTDPDDLKHLNGAEAREYAREKMSPPPNRRLLTRREISSVMGWRNYPQLWNGDTFFRAVTVAHNGMINFNTSPKIILKTVENIDEETADRIIAYRKQNTIMNSEDLNRIAGKRISLNPFSSAYFPSRFLRISIWREGEPGIHEIHLKLTPRSNNEKPWRIQHEVEAPVKQDNLDEEINLYDIPSFSAAVHSDAA